MWHCSFGVFVFWRVGAVVFSALFFSGVFDALVSWRWVGMFLQHYWRVKSYGASVPVAACNVSGVNVLPCR